MCFSVFPFSFFLSLFFHSPLLFPDSMFLFLFVLVLSLSFNYCVYLFLFFPFVITCYAHLFLPLSRLPFFFFLCLLFFTFFSYSFYIFNFFPYLFTLYLFLPFFDSLASLPLPSFSYLFVCLFPFSLLVIFVPTGRADHLCLLAATETT
jgi:hypothetical protein